MPVRRLLPEMERYSDYDRFAWFYNQHWGAEYHSQTLPILDRLILAQLPPAARILDLGCGTGGFTRSLAERGFAMTGMDGSEQMLHHARENVPSADFILADARNFDLSPSFHAVISTFEALNHVMSIAELGEVFRNVYHALIEGGVFVFDLNREEAFSVFWPKPFVLVEEDHVIVTQGNYDSGSKIASCHLTMFRLHERWERSDLTLSQKCHDAGQVEHALEQAGFKQLNLYDARQDLGMSGDIGHARTFFVAAKAA